MLVKAQIKSKFVRVWLLDVVNQEIIMNCCGTYVLILICCLSLLEWATYNVDLPTDYALKDQKTTFSLFT